MKPLLMTVFCLFYLQLPYADSMATEAFIQAKSRPASERRIFSEKLAPDEFFIDEPATAIVSAEVLRHNLPLSSVMVYRVDENGDLLTPLGRMYDDGTHGDRRAGDTIFSTTLHFNEDIETTLYFRVVVEYAGDVERYFGSMMASEFLKAVPAASMMRVSETLKAIKALYLKRRSIAFQREARMSQGELRELAYREALIHPDIKSVVLHDIYLSIVFKDNIRGSVRLTEECGC